MSGPGRPGLEGAVNRGASLQCSQPTHCCATGRCAITSSRSPAPSHCCAALPSPGPGQLGPRPNLVSQPPPASTPTSLIPGSQARPSCWCRTWMGRWLGMTRPQPPSRAGALELLCAHGAEVRAGAAASEAWVAPVAKGAAQNKVVYCKRRWEQTAVPRGGVLVYNTGR